MYDHTTPNAGSQMKWPRNDLAASACGAGLDTLSLADLYGRLVVDGRGAHAFLDLSCHGKEGLLDV